MTAPNENMPMPHELEAGAVAYEAYRRACAGMSLETGAELKDWSDLGIDEQQVWITVAEESIKKGRQE